MKIEKKISDGKMTVVVAGNVDTTTAPEFSAALDLEGVNEATIDLSGVSYMSSVGLRCLLVAKKTMTAQGGEIKLKGVQKPVKDVLDMTGFSSFFEFI